VFDALEWLAAMTSHIPNEGEQMVRYYGYYSNGSFPYLGVSIAADHNSIPCLFRTR